MFISLVDHKKIIISRYNFTTSRFTFHVLYISITYGILINVTLEPKNGLKSLGYIYSNSQQYIVWVKIIEKI